MPLYHYPLSLNNQRTIKKGLDVHHTVQPILDFISPAGVTGRWGLPSHTQNTVRGLTLNKMIGRDSDSLKAPSLHAAVLCMNNVYALLEEVGSQ